MSRLCACPLLVCLPARLIEWVSFCVFLFISFYSLLCSHASLPPQIDRKDRASAVLSLQLAASCVQRGQSVTISPEGTRSTTGLLLPFKKGGEGAYQCCRTF